LVAAVAAFVLWASLREDDVSTPPESYSPPAERKIYVVPLGDVPEGDVAFACRVLEASLGREAVVAKPLSLQEAYYYPGRGQYGAAGLLGYLEANAPPEAYRVVGVTAQDIFTGDLNFLFGMARCPGGAAVTSTHRMGFYCDSSQRRLVRFAKLIVHESGHTFGLMHCRQPRCAMKYAIGFKTLDRTRIALCERCEGNLCWLGATDAAARRAKIEAVITAYGLLEEAGGPDGLEPPAAPADLSPEKTLGG
jgi:archaemetzincin